MADTLAGLLAQRDQLTQQLAALDGQINEARRAERQETIQKIRELMTAGGVTVEDLGKGSATPTRGQKGPKAGAKVAAKFRNPASGETWSGRGLKPRWLAEALKDGKAVEDFLITRES